MSTGVFSAQKADFPSTVMQEDNDAIIDREIFITVYFRSVIFNDFI